MTLEGDGHTHVISTPRENRTKYPERWSGVNSYQADITPVNIRGEIVKLLPYTPPECYSFEEEEKYREGIMSFPTRLVLVTGDGSFLEQNLRWGPSWLRTIGDDPKQGIEYAEVHVSGNAVDHSIQVGRVDPRWYSPSGRWISSEAEYLAQEGFLSDLLAS